ncbi:MAG: hypothetical protein FJ318_06915 [SAR202 cluster bacterium]|nr:hypothetical protein [SAR202 cluster bacterium]
MVQPSHAIDVTDLAGFMVTPSLQRVAFVDALRRRGPDPRRDYYRAFREALVELSRRERTVGSLESLAGRQAPRKQGNYRALARNVAAFLASNGADLREAARFAAEVDAVRVRVVPEVDVAVGGQRHPTVAWLQTLAPTAQYVETLLLLLRSLGAARGPAGTTPAMLDLARGRLHLAKAVPPLFDRVLRGEVRTLSEIWNELDARL